MMKTLILTILFLFSARAEILSIDVKGNILIKDSDFLYHTLWESADLTNWTKVTTITNNILFCRGRVFQQHFYATTPLFNAPVDNSSIYLIFYIDDTSIYPIGSGFFTVIPEKNQIIYLDNTVTFYPFFYKPLLVEDVRLRYGKFGVIANITLKRI